MKLMKLFRVAVITVTVVAFGPSRGFAEESSWVESYNRLLKHYVTPSGVKYAEWKKNSADMQAIGAVVDGISRESVSSLGTKEQLAFYLNAYNAWILHGALAKYPTKSVKDTFFRFFTADNIKVAGKQTSFKKLEDEVIRGKFSDPHVHFALNCASRSCPPLLPEAFDGGKVDAQMEKLAVAFVNSEKGVAYNAANETAQISKIFDWYKSDFARNGGAIEFINKRRSTPIPKGAKITYQDYNWSLNQAK